MCQIFNSMQISVFNSMHISAWQMASADWTLTWDLNPNSYMRSEHTPLLPGPAVVHAARLLGPWPCRPCRQLHPLSRTPLPLLVSQLHTAWISQCSWTRINQVC